jgi:hypothetical protein
MLKIKAKNSPRELKRLQEALLFSQANYNTGKSKRQTHREAGAQSHGSVSNTPADRQTTEYELWWSVFFY